MSSTSDTPAGPDPAGLARARRVFGVTAARMDMILLTLNHGEVTATEFMDKLGLSRSGVERQLKLLTEQGILSERRATQPRNRGQIIYWRIANPAELRRLWNLISEQIDAGVNRELERD
jgi:predicted ArsR family transcriptional regulator